MLLDKLDIRGNRSIKTPSGQTVYPVPDTHTLIQAAGYLKHIRGCKNGELVYFRGAPELYDTLKPTAFRAISTNNGAAKAIARIHATIAEFARPLKSTGAYAHEALLQHYGLKTTWVDLIDNIWVALWFACHHARAVGPCGEYLHFERRVPRTDKSGKAYVFLVAADAVAPDPKCPGLFAGEHTELIDLRIAAPSIFVRPHAQHGLLMRVRGNTVQRPLDYSSQIRGVLEIQLADAIEWLGDSAALSTHSLFPPPFYDNGYLNLLSVGFKGAPNIGCISHVSA